MSFWNFLKPKKANYKVLMLGEVQELKSHYPNLPIYDAVTKFIIDHDESEWNNFFEKHPEKSPKLYLASTLSNIIADYLESGQFHLYRGILSPDGEAMYKMLLLQLNIQKDAGEIDSAYIDHYLRVLKSNISDVG